MSKFCSKCGNQLSDEAMFCTKCGSQFSAVQQSADTGQNAELPANNSAPENTQASGNAQKPKKRISKKLIIIPATALVLAAAILFTCLTLFSSGGQPKIVSLSDGTAAIDLDINQFKNGFKKAIPFGTSFIKSLGWAEDFTAEELTKMLTTAFEDTTKWYNYEETETSNYNWTFKYSDYDSYDIKIAVDKKSNKITNISSSSSYSSDVLVKSILTSYLLYGDNAKATDENYERIYQTIQLVQKLADDYIDKKYLIKIDNLAIVSVRSEEGSKYLFIPLSQTELRSIPSGYTALTLTRDDLLVLDTALLAKYGFHYKMPTMPKKSVG